MNAVEQCPTLNNLAWCYKILFGIVHLESEECFELNMRPSTRSHRHKLCKNLCISCKGKIFSERVVSAWNSLPSDLDLGTLQTSFKRSIETVDLTSLLVFLKRKCFYYWSAYVNCFVVGLVRLLYVPQRA